MDIRITSTPTKYQIETRRAQLDLKNNGKLDYKICHTDPQLQIETTKPKLYIDQSAAFGDEGLKNNRDLMADISDYSKQALLQYIQRQTEIGDSYAAIQNKENRNGKAIVNAIKQDANKTCDFNIGLMPEHAPEITVEPGEITTNIIRGEVTPEFNNVPIDIEFTPPEFNYSIAQYGSVQIDYVGKYLDAKV